MDKCAELQALARKRAMTRWPPHKCLGDYHGGIYECDFVTPFTKAAGNEEAEILVLLQDWSSDSELSGPIDEDAARCGYTPTQPTTKNLIRLLEATFDCALCDVYGTNLFPFIKMGKGKMSASIPKADLVRAAREFAMPQIQIVAPRLVICLGLATFNALQKASGLNPSMRMHDAIASPFDFSGARIWCQAHTGYFGQANRRKVKADQVLEDWHKMKTDVRGV